MSWEETWVMSRRIEMVLAALGDGRSVAGLSREFGVSRKTVHKWINRFEAKGAAGLQSKSREPSHPNQTSEKIREELLKVKKVHRTWGPRKILAYLAHERPQRKYPAASTVGSIFKKSGLVKPRRDYGPKARSTSSRTQAMAPNDVWTADFKGNFLLQNGRRCYPLTIVDQFSRFILSCEGMEQPRKDPCQAEFERVFSEYGLPRVIRTDNGEPFACRGLWRLTPLSVWWRKLGIRVEQIDVGCPEQNGSHERMHRDLKAQTTRPPARTLSGQRRRFKRFIQVYNEVRPHEGLGQARPADRYRRSERTYPCPLREVQYPGHYELRKVTGVGVFTWKYELIYVSASLSGELVGLLEIDDGLWRVYYDGLELGVLDERKKTKPGHLKKVLPMCPV